MGKFEKYLTLWVLLCIAVGIGIGQIAGDSIEDFKQLGNCNGKHTCCYFSVVDDLPHDGTNRFFIY
jgi:ACR3 family arsenite efflux pump ArsB